MENSFDIIPNKEIAKQINQENISQEKLNYLIQKWKIQLAILVEPIKIYL
ncbi:MAG: hypothetical protein GY870_10670 [archaeon]|nr:hypothetical protein [archaeon]